MISYFRLFAVATALGALGLGHANAQPGSADSRWEPSVVTVEITHKQYDYQQPWSKRTRTAQKTGVVIGSREILVTAEEVSDRTLVRLQKDGRGKWWNGEVSWVDYHANLALVTTADESFWQNLKPVSFADPIPTKDNFKIVRWKNGNLESRKAEYNQFLVEDGRFTFIQHLQLEVSSDMNGVGWGEPVIVGNKVIGIAAGSSGNNVRVLPSSFILPILEAHKKNKFSGLGYFPFVWQPIENPSVFKFLKLDGEPRGAVVGDVPEIPGVESTLKPRDILLQVDGMEIDSQGYYKDPDYGLLILENLATRHKFSKDSVKLKIWRDGKAMDINYKLPKVDYAHKLVPDQTFDQEPEYLITGGLVFQPLTGSYLRSWGQDWRRNAPFRLAYYYNESPKPDRPSLVLLSVVLPDGYNIGYQDARALVVDQVNGQKISRLQDLDRALQQPVNGFHIIEFMRGDSLRRIVLDATELDGATKRILQRFGIPKDRVIHAPLEKASAN